VTAFIPIDFKNTRAKTIWEMIRGYKKYQRIFQKGDGYASKLDCILTSVGSHEQPNKLWTKELDSRGVDPKELQELSCGDIGGVLLPRARLTNQQKKRFDDIIAHWTGIAEQHYTLCANRATKSDVPGVLVVAIGENKTDILAECLRRGLVNEVFVDEELARTLVKRVEQPMVPDKGVEND